VVPADSDRVSRARPYSGTRLGSPSRFRLQGYYLLWREFPPASTNAWFCNFPTRRQTDQDGPYNTRVTTAAAYHVTQVWALPLSLATTQGVEVSFLSSGY
jgi:hypothetical protein